MAKKRGLQTKGPGRRSGKEWESRGFSSYIPESPVVLVLSIIALIVAVPSFGFALLAFYQNGQWPLALLLAAVTTVLIILALRKDGKRRRK